LGASTERKAASAVVELSNKPTPLHPSGTERQKAVGGTRSISRSTSDQRWSGAFLRSAKSVAASIGLAPQRSFKANTAVRTAERVRCVSVESAGRADVYCLTVPATGCFAIEGGLVVSNCGDEWRYACMSRPYQPVKIEPPKPTELQYEVKNGRVVANMSVMDIVNAKMRKKARE
jgi:hypothetical protein